MANKCIYHPGRDATLAVGGKNYCAQCDAGIKAAVALVSRHVEPKECFVWYVRQDVWQSISGTGCAHWIAHQRNIQSTIAAEACLTGQVYRVRTLIHGLPTVAVSQVQVGDIYVSPAIDHVGLISRIVPGAANKETKIYIRHDSSGQGGVFENEFATYFHGRGSFRRLA